MVFSWCNCKLQHTCSSWKHCTLTLLPISLLTIAKSCPQRHKSYVSHSWSLDPLQSSHAHHLSPFILPLRHVDCHLAMLCCHLSMLCCHLAMLCCHLSMLCRHLAMLCCHLAMLCCRIAGLPLTPAVPAWLHAAAPGDHHRGNPGLREPPSLSSLTRSQRQRTR